MRGGLVIGAGGALHGARIVCDAMRCARAGCIRAVRCDARDAMRGPMRCELVAMQCAALRCTVRGLFAMRCAARGLVAFARCRWRHAFDGGIFRVGWVAGGMGGWVVGGMDGWCDGWDGWMV
jgi:hypothetical protein